MLFANGITPFAADFLGGQKPFANGFWEKKLAKPVAYKNGLLSINYGLLWSIVACFLGPFGVPGKFLGVEEPFPHCSWEVKSNSRMVSGSRTPFANGITHLTAGAAGKPFTNGFWDDEIHSRMVAGITKSTREWFLGVQKLFAHGSCEGKSIREWFRLEQRNNLRIVSGKSRLPTKGAATARRQPCRPSSLQTRAVEGDACFQPPDGALHSHACIRNGDADKMTKNYGSQWTARVCGPHGLATS